MHGGDEQAFAGDGDIGSRGRPRLTLPREWNNPRLLEWLGGQDCIAADRSVCPTKRKEKRKQVPRCRHSAERLIVTFDVLLQQHDVIARRAARQPTGREVVNKSREFALASVHVPRRDRECDGGQCGGWSGHLRPYAAGQRERCNYRNEGYWGVRPRSSANTGIPSSTMTKPGQVVAGR